MHIVFRKEQFVTYFQKGHFVTILENPFWNTFYELQIYHFESQKMCFKKSILGWFFCLSDFLFRKQLLLTGIPKSPKTIKGNLGILENIRMKEENIGV